MKVFHLAYPQLSLAVLWSHQIFKWMYLSAKEMKLSPNGWVGGIHHDETRVQQDLIVDMQDGIPSLIGWIDLKAFHWHFL
jgi:hypothetical protein